MAAVLYIFGVLGLLGCVWYVFTIFGNGLPGSTPGFAVAIAIQQLAGPLVVSVLLLAGGKAIQLLERIAEALERANAPHG